MLGRCLAPGDPRTSKVLQSLKISKASSHLEKAYEDFDKCMFLSLT